MNLGESANRRMAISLFEGLGQLFNLLQIVDLLNNEQEAKKPKVAADCSPKPW